MPSFYNVVKVRENRTKDGELIRNFYIEEVVTIKKRIDIQIPKQNRDAMQAALSAAVEAGHPIPLKVSDIQNRTYTDKNGVERPVQYVWLEDLPE